MLGFHCVEVVIFVDVEEGEETAVDPSTTLFHQVLVILHGIRLCYSIWDVSQVIFFLGLAVNTQTEDTILCQVHICLTVILLLELRVQNHLEVTMLKKVRLVFL